LRFAASIAARTPASLLNSAGVWPTQAPTAITTTANRIINPDWHKPRLHFFSAFSPRSPRRVESTASSATYAIMMKP
jgi:hypothetical protein